MNKELIIEHLQGKFPNIQQKDLKAIVAEVGAFALMRLVWGEKFKLIGLGTFWVKVARPKNARNPKTGEPVSVPQRRRVQFRPTKPLRDAMHGKSHEA